MLVSVEAMMHFLTYVHVVCALDGRSLGSSDLLHASTEYEEATVQDIRSQDLDQHAIAGSEPEQAIKESLTKWLPGLTAAMSGEEASPIQTTATADFDDWLKKLAGVATGDHEGDIESFSEEVEAFALHARKDNVKTICETGFNRGFTSLLWLVSNPTARVFSFDLGAHATVKKGAEFLQRNFVDSQGKPRLTLTLGDSTKTIVDFHGKNPEVKCDFVLVDGGHDVKIAEADIANFHNMSREKVTLIVDDTPCTAGFCIGPTAAVEGAVKKNIAEKVSAVPSPKKGVTRGYTVLTYKK